MIYQHPLAYLLALQGGALLRAFNGEYDREFTEARLDAPPAERVLPEHPSDIWTLKDWCPAAARAALNGTPCLIFWHFQLA